MTPQKSVTHGMGFVRVDVGTGILVGTAFKLNVSFHQFFSEVCVNVPTTVGGIISSVYLDKRFFFTKTTTT